MGIKLQCECVSWVKRSANIRTLFSCVIIVLLFLFTGMSGCSKTPPEDAILANVNAIRQAIEAKQSSEVLDFITEDFQGRHGLDKQGVRRLLVMQFLRHANVTILITKMNIHVNTTVPDQASMVAVVLLMGTDHLLPRDGRLYNVTGEWQLRDGNWLLTKLVWK